MKVLTVGNFSGPSWDGSQPDEEHIAQALEEMGVEVIRSQREERVRLVRDIDFVLIAQWDGYPVDFLEVTRTMTYGAPIVYWAFDYQADGQEWHERLVAESDLYLSKRIADSKYPNWQWLSQDFAPSFLDRYQEPISHAKYEMPIHQDIDVLFTGTYLPWATERNETLKAVDQKFSLTIHSVNPQEWISAGFKNVHGPKMDMELPELYARAKVILSIDHTIEAGYWSDRNAQAMCCGGAVLFRYVPLSASVFRNKVAYFYNVDGCLENLEWLLNDEDTRNHLSVSAYVYAQSNLKVSNRVADLLTIVGSIL